MAARPFSLSKWYLDVVTPAGEACIAYVAELSWGRLRLSYTSVLTASPERSPRVTTSLRPAALPTVQDDALRWASRPLDVEGTWRARGKPVERTLIDDARGHVRWSCLQPLAEVEVRVGRRTLRGAGYAEHVSLTLAPWRLPIDELRWGRALLGGHSVVWLDWRGPESFLHVFLDGREVRAPQVHDFSVEGDGVSLQLSAATTLRRGALVNTALAMVPGIRRLFPKRGLFIDEHKWLSHAALRLGDEELEGGWAIHEVVKWA